MPDLNFGLHCDPDPISGRSPGTASNCQSRAFVFLRHRSMASGLSSMEYLYEPWPNPDETSCAATCNTHGSSRTASPHLSRRS